MGAWAVTCAMPVWYKGFSCLRDDAPYCSNGRGDDSTLSACELRVRVVDVVITFCDCLGCDVSAKSEETPLWIARDSGREVRGKH